MIPTYHKAKLSQRLSYPAGAETLTEGLGDAPHVASFRVTFSGQPTWPDARVQKAATGDKAGAENRPHMILAAEYVPAHKQGYLASHAMVEQGWCDDRWMLTVYPVVRAMRSVAHRLLREQGLPRVAAWLRTSERAGWLGRRQRVELIFDPVGPAITERTVQGV